MSDTYTQFLESKRIHIEDAGIVVDPQDLHPKLFPFQRDIVRWALRKGRAAIFANFGLGKTLMQLEIARQLLAKTPGRFLIVTPLGVRQEFRRDAKLLGLDPTFIRSTEDLSGPSAESHGVYMTNYESVREGKIAVNEFIGVSLDEASILRGFGGTKTFREFMRLFEGNSRVRYRFVATATPSPNEYIELLAYSAFLEVMDVGQAKTRFFKRDSIKADCLTLHPHKEREFWLWLSTWAVFVQKPSDLGYSDEGYELPEMEVNWHEVGAVHSDAGFESNGQARLLADAAISVRDAAREKRKSLPARIARLMTLRADGGIERTRIIWHDLEAERDAIEKAIPTAVSVYGNQPLDVREQAIIDFSDGKIQELAAKPVMAGSGCNFQRYCDWAIFLGIGFKFNDFIQAIHRIHRFLQTRKVRIDLIYTESEREVRRVLQEKWDKHKELTAQMSAIIREYGLARNALAVELERSFDVTRDDASGKSFRLICGDTVIETPKLESASVGLVLTSIPFSTQYEYTPSYRDFGHTDSNEHFFAQMDFLTPELYRVLMPGRVAAIHVKDRVVPGGMTGLGFQTVYPFHGKCIEHYIRHGFAYLGMKTIVTDVVRENNQTYRLGWTEQCKDGSRMGVGMPEYLLLFRKPPTDSSNGYADLPVLKDKAEYSRSRWQIDAHGFARSSGNRLLIWEDLNGLSHQQIFQLFRRHSLGQVYDFENHVRLGESLEARKILPVTFMLLQPQSWHPDVWTDITRMLSLNTAQSASGREMHLCPMQFDLADRVIAQFSMKGETVFDPFSGLGTVPYRAVLAGRFGLGVELSRLYHQDAIYYCQAAEQQRATPTLFDLDAEEPLSASQRV